MFHRKLLEILVRLTPAELKSFRLFLESPYFNGGSNRKTLLNLFDQVMRYQADETHPQLSKEALFRHFYPDRAFVENAKTPLDASASNLFLLLKKYLSQQDLEKKQVGSAEHLPLLQFYRKHGLEDRFLQLLEAARRANDEVGLQTPDFFYQCFRLEEEVSNFGSMYNTFEGDANLVEVHRNLDQYYSLFKLEYLCAHKAQKKYSAVAHDVPVPLSEALFELIIQQPDYLSSPYVKIYLLIYDLLSDHNNDDKLIELNHLLGEYRSIIPKDAFQNMQAYNRSFYIRRFNEAGGQAATLQIYTLAAQHLQEGYFYVENKIMPTSLRLLVFLGLSLKRYDWVKKVLDEHLPERICATRFPAEVHSLYYAEYFFALKRYEEAIDKLLLKPFEMPHMNLMADLLLVKIYYETQSTLLESRMKALDQKVRRTKIAADTKQRYYNFLKKVDKLIKYGWDKKNPKRQKLIEEIKQSPNLFSRSWLLEQLGAG